ncbi:MAG: DNA mismatch repair protein MutS [Eubacteriales bacterium]|nr:DNA mismatch repair protein MutS [Eubacteriales bacterium]
MMRHYLATKEKYPDCILFYRLGDFYEMFFEDAQTVSRELDLTLTGKDCGLSERAPMCGVPYHAADAYLAKLIAKNYKVAICEQMEDPATAKGLVERDVVRIVTPGTVIETAMLDERAPNYILSLYIRKEAAGAALCDVSTGEFRTWQITGAKSRLADELSRVQARELLVNDAALYAQYVPQSALRPQEYAAEMTYAQALKLLCAHFHASSEEELGLEGKKAAAQACAALMRYLSETQKNALSHILKIEPFTKGAVLQIDRIAARNLELSQAMYGGGKKGSLLGLMDKTVTSMGARLMREWLERPLGSKAEIEERLDAVGYLKDNPIINDELRERLDEVYDVERLTSRIAYDTVNGRDCLAILRSLRAVPHIAALFTGELPSALRRAVESLDPLEALADRIEEQISPDTPVHLKDGGVIRTGYSAKLDELRSISRDAKSYIAALENSEREKTGIKNLKIGYNRVFGYYIEVTRSFYDLVPYRYARRQTLANSERFTTDELIEFEKKAMSADTDALRLEQTLFDELKALLRESLLRMHQTTAALKELDALAALAHLAMQNDYVRPSLNEQGRYSIENGRHPVVEQAMEHGSYVPNDVALDSDHRVMIITGPNMAGKSTYMRQVALIVLMAHMGSFVPADSADVSVTDRIFTRIGASDDLYGGRSTFMVEMSELAGILRYATEKSLILLDEVGRGTSTFDGLSIAWAAVEHIAGASCGARTLFATHYHELSSLEGQLQGVVNFRITAKEQGNDVIFLRKVVPGGADKSYGVAVASLAGLPASLISRARQIMARLETNDEAKGSIGQTILDKRKNGGNRQLSLTDLGPMQLIDEIRELDVMSMSPIDALNTLFKLTEKARRI